MSVSCALNFGKFKRFRTSAVGGGGLIGPFYIFLKVCNRSVMLVSALIRAMLIVTLLSDDADAANNPQTAAAAAANSNCSPVTPVSPVTPAAVKCYFCLDIN